MYLLHFYKAPHNRCTAKTLVVSIQIKKKTENKQATLPQSSKATFYTYATKPIPIHTKENTEAS